MHTVALVLTLVGAIAVVQFVAFAFSARQLAHTAVPRLRRRIESPMIRNARGWAVVGAAVTLAGVVLLPV